MNEEEAKELLEEVHARAFQGKLEDESGKAYVSRRLKKYETVGMEGLHGHLRTYYKKLIDVNENAKIYRHYSPLSNMVKTKVTDVSAIEHYKEAGRYDIFLLIEYLNTLDSKDESELEKVVDNWYHLALACELPSNRNHTDLPNELEEGMICTLNDDLKPITGKENEELFAVWERCTTYNRMYKDVSYFKYLRFDKARKDYITKAFEKHEVKSKNVIQAFDPATLDQKVRFYKYVDVIVTDNDLEDINGLKECIECDDKVNHQWDGISS